MSDILKFVIKLLVAVIVLSGVTNFAFGLLSGGRFISGGIILLVVLAVIFYLGDRIREQIENG